ncbi:MAG: imidazole glycerol phosphate synthase subunit HisH [Proteobacteria bacterium]|nr:imidazole glycerol phosphate synthase subunit HisH [Pseudomonadota bacterium]MBU1451087.1 imidazole glycerol phosphate synthase subunit HisH [Pseudomonadota bacterium]MBU2467779.1 imidazole glycerol phosphate synthase subunit HisH [Pseudomonadota bacterium]MBU2517821.1 imidazole glycerol phosphate synthase subunit HisH [Pseudomonadota bacterium]
MIAIIDYDAGNLTSVERALRSLGADCAISRDPGFIAQAQRVILPGVGRAGAGMASLRRLGLDRVLADTVAQGKPFLGICFGTQIIFDYSEEDLTGCLGLMPGKVVRFPVDHRDTAGNPLKVPHMGWNGVSWKKRHPVFAGIPEQAEFYFVHSYYLQPDGDNLVAGVTDYGFPFASAVARGSLVAVQFHPEKSGRPGLKLLDNFLAWDGKEAGDAL